MESMQHVSLSGMKRKYSLHCPQFLKTGNSPEFSMHGGPVCGQGTASLWLVGESRIPYVGIRGNMQMFRVISV